MFDFHLHGARSPFTQRVIMGGSGEGAGGAADLLQPACDRLRFRPVSDSVLFLFVLTVGGVMS